MDSPSFRGWENQGASGIPSETALFVGCDGIVHWGRQADLKRVRSRRVQRGPGAACLCGIGPGKTRRRSFPGGTTGLGSRGRAGSRCRRGWYTLHVQDKYRNPVQRCKLVRWPFVQWQDSGLWIR